MDLYEKMIQFLPDEIECVGHTGYFGFHHAATFLHDAIDSTDDMLVIIDEDAFVVDWSCVFELCRFVKDRDITHCGVPDGGVIPHRCHSYLTMNPFFLILNCKLIKELQLGIERETIDRWGFSTEMERHRPVWLDGSYCHDMDEPFTGLFYWLAQVGSPYFLKAFVLDDGISTAIIDDNGFAFCLHSWYSRLYKEDSFTRGRIDALHQFALNTRLS